MRKAPSPETATTPAAAARPAKASRPQGGSLKGMAESDELLERVRKLERELANEVRVRQRLSADFAAASRKIVKLEADARVTEAVERGARRDSARAFRLIREETERVDETRKKITRLEKSLEPVARDLRNLTTTFHSADSRCKKDSADNRRRISRIEDQPRPGIGSDQPTPQFAATAAALLAPAQQQAQLAL